MDDSRLTSRVAARFLAASPDYIPQEDRKGQPLRPGDRVRVKLYPRGSGEGIVVVHPRAFDYRDGKRVPVLAVEIDGRLYDLNSKGALKLA